MKKRTTEKNYPYQNVLNSPALTVAMAINKITVIYRSIEFSLKCVKISILTDIIEYFVWWSKQIFRYVFFSFYICP